MNRPYPLSRFKRCWRPVLAATALAAGLLGAGSAQAQASLALCERGKTVTAGDQDLVLRFTAVVLEELNRSGGDIALISRAGTDLRRFGIRYSHAGLTIKDNPEGAWSVRQLYYVCDESRPRIFDQGLGAFLMAGRATGATYVSLVTLPDGRDQTLRDRALDKPSALRLLSDRYSANAYVYGLRYQNCNQWVAEMMAAAWDDKNTPPPARDLPPAVPASAPASAPTSASETASYDRARAQQWLRAQHYDPAPVEVNSHLLMFAGQFVPLLHVDDHPIDDLYGLRQRISLPAGLEHFMQRQVDGARRVELCLKGRQIVIHHGWTPIGDDCTPTGDDEVRTLS